jgi:hypothetical protein
VGKRLLLRAADLYGGEKHVPRGEEGYLFLYRVHSIKENCTHAKIAYENKYIEEGTSEYRNFPALDDDDEIVDNYRLDLLRADHELYNKYLGLIKKKDNDVKEMERRMEDERKKSSLTDVSDINRRIQQQRQNAYDVLLLEFEAEGVEEEHIISAGPNIGKISSKQKWSKFILIWCKDYLLFARMN